MEGAQSNPLTGAADSTNTTGWKAAADADELNGYRYFRIKLVLKPGTVAGTMPSVTEVRIMHQYKK